MKKDKSTLSPSLRRRILARDKFTCTECGKQVPRVFLYIDRILSPNTAEEIGSIPEEDKYTCLCESCSRKHRHKLQTHGIITTAERRAQLDLLIAWRREEETLNEVAFDIILDYLRPQIKPAYLYKAEKTKLRNYLKTYDILDILNAIDTAVAKYARFEGDDCLQESVTDLVTKMGGILYNNTLGPIDSEVSHIRHICRKNFPDDYNDREAKAILHEFVEGLKRNGIEEESYILSELASKPKHFAGSCGTFGQWSKSMLDLLPKEDWSIIPLASNEEPESTDQQEYRYSFSEDELTTTMSITLKTISSILKTLLHFYVLTGCYTKERWYAIIEYLDRVVSDFLYQQHMCLRESFDVPPSSPIRDAIEPYFSEWEFNDLLYDHRHLPENSVLDSDVRRIVLNHVLPDLAYKFFSFFDTYSEQFDYEATRQAVSYLLDNYKSVLESSKQEADSLQSIAR